MKKVLLLSFSAPNTTCFLSKNVLFLALLLISAISSKAQVDVTASGGTPSASYTTLKTAFDSINTGAHTGTIGISLTGNTTETASAVLNASGSGTSSYTSITISPTGGASRTISGSIAGALIDLNGADNVIIDGLNSGGNALVIDNSNTGGAGTSSIRLINDASNNQLKNATIRGASTAITTGTVLFSTGTTTGNDNNLVSGCTLEGSGATFHTNAIVSIGTISVGVENSGNFITENNISNFFSATLVSSGVSVGAGNTDWAISKNKLFQTATRTYTTANTHQVIAITSGNGHRVDSNTIGYSSSSGTGTYTMAGTIATRFIAIDLNVGTTTATSVQFNTITAISLATSSGAATANGILCGISVKGGNVNIGTLYGNTIGATTGTGAITATPTTTQGAIVGINSATTGTIQIHNNYVGALTSTGTTASIAGGIFGVTVSAVAASISIRYNTFGNPTADNMRAGTSGTTTGSSIAAGIILPSNSISAIIKHNTIRNITSYGTGTTGYVRGIATSISAADNVLKIDSNDISFLATNSTLASETSGQLGALGILSGTGLDAEIAGNIIHDISHLNTGAFGTDACGIALGVAKGPLVFGNSIYRIKNASTNATVTAPGTASGITIRSGVALTSPRIFNNMISLGAGEVTNTSFIGIWANHGSTPDPIDSIYNNTITIEGNGATGAQPSFCIARTDFSTTARTATMVALNNILTNNRTGGTGKHYALNNNYGASTPSATGWGTNASNYNVLNAITSSTVASWGSVDKTFADWKTISNSDANSYTAVTVHYLDSSYDLHLNIGVTPNQMESNALPLATVTSDFDGDVRPGPVGSVNGGGSLPDIGADEFDGVGIDLNPPQITYTTLSKTCSTSDRVLTATIADQTGVNTIGTLLPRVYYKKGSGGLWVSQPGTLMSGTTTSGTWDFPILSIDMGGLMGGDSVYYYVIAQDSGAASVNLRSMPSGVVATDVNTITTPPTVLNSYAIGPDLNGLYTLNSGAANSSTNFQSMAFLQSAIGTGCMSGPVTIEITTASGPYSGSLIIPEISGMSSTNTLTLNGNNETIQHTPNTTDRHIIKLDGADYVTLKNLNIVGLDPTFDWGIHLTNGADHDSILNCVVNLAANTSTTIDNSACIVASASTTDVNLAGNNANYVTIENCELIGGYQALIINGSATNNSMHNSIRNNIIRDFYLAGTELTHNDSTVFENNNTSRAIRTTVTTFEGIELGVGNKQLRINANRFHDTHNSASTQTGTAYGIYSASNDAPLGFENWITNNLIYNFNSGSGTIYAIYSVGSDGIFYYHNTISLDNANSTAGVTRGFFQTTLASNVDFRNNIISITRGGTGIKYCLYFATATSSIISNKNVLYINAPAGTNGIGFFSAGQTTLADWKLVNSNAYDQQSIATNPNFTAPLTNDYTPFAFAVNDIGDSVGVFTDFNGMVRPSNTPDLGALEFSPPAIDAEISWVAPLAPLSAGNKTITINVKNNSASTTITDIELEYTDGVTPVFETFSGLTLLPSGNQQLSFTTQYNLTGPTTFRAYIKTVNGTSDGTPENDTTANTPLCVALAGGTYTIDASLPTDSGNFASFTDAVNQLGCGILGPVILNVVPGSGPYTEQISIPAIAGSSSVNTLTINGNGDTIQFTPNTAARHIIKLDGADYVTLRDLNILGLAIDFDWGIHLTNSANYDSIVNCTINLSANTSTTIDNSASIVASASTIDVNLAGNNATNLTVTGCTMIGGYYGAVINGNGVNTQNNNLINNTIRDFYSIGIEYTQMDSCLISGNDISRANRVIVTTFEGIEIGAGCKRTVSTKNKIHDTHNSATTQSGSAYGIFNSAVDAPVGFENIVSNNLIYNFNSTTGLIYGLYNSGSDGVYYYYNTVDLSNTASTAGTTYGIYQITAATNIEMKNNIVSITRGGSGGKNCLRFATTTSSIVSNNNLLYMNSPAGTNGVGFYSVNEVTLANWKLANGGAYDQQSVSADPLFNSPSLFIPMPNSVAVGAGTPISGVTIDILDSTRNISTPTIGAYEKATDLRSPSISLQNLTNTQIASSRILNNFATITDVSGIDTISNKPRLYFKKSSDDNTYTGNTSVDNGWKWTEAVNNVSPFSFTVDYSQLFGGAVLGGDTIQYFVVAQDMSENTNIAISSGVFNTLPDSVDLTAAAFPITGSIQYYRILPNTAGGSITVGATGTYLNLTAALAYLKENNFTSDVIVELLPDYNGSTGETFPLSFSQILRADSSIKITVRPEINVSTMLVTEGVPATDMPLIDLNGIHNIHFDGRPGGTGDMTNIKWTIRNKRVAATFTPTIRFINDARYNVLEYLNIQSANTLTTSGTVLFSTTTGVYGNDSNIIRYNIIRDRSDTIGIAANAIYSAGTAAASNHYNRIENNELFNFTTSAINIAATGNGGNWYIGDNSIYYNYATAATTAQTSILFAAASNNNTIYRNTIGGSAPNAAGSPWTHNGTTAFIGISASFDSLSTSVISNNSIRNIAKTNTGGGAITGILVSRGNALISYNVIGDTLTPNSITNAGTAAIVGISNTNPLLNTLVTIEHNRVANITSSNAGTGAIIRGISYTSGLPYPACNILHNKVFKLSTNSAAAGYAAGSIAAQGIYTFPVGYGAPSEMAYNTVYDITGTNTSATAAINISGITSTNFAGTIHHNTIYDIKNFALDSGSLRPTANGMYFRFLDSATTIHNNMVSLTNNPSDSVQMNGIFITGANGSAQFYFYNSVLIANTSGLPVSSFAFHRGENSLITQSYQPIVMQNNLFINTVTSPGLHYAIGNEGSRPDSSWISTVNNYNNFYSVNPANLTLWGTTTGDLTSWQTLSLGDANSVSKVVNYLNPASADLHLTGASIGDFDLAGTPIVNYTTDFDGEVRNPFRPYMGADELPSNPVPVVLTAFTATAQNKDVLLNWITVSEVNASRYIIEASADGRQFKAIGSLKAKGQSSTTLRYQFTHYNAQKAFNETPVLYYRLISVDIDGQSSVSEIVTVSFQKGMVSKNMVSIAPNPFTSNFALTINALEAGSLNLEVFNGFGHIIYSQTNSISEGLNKYDINTLENLPKGIYFVRAIMNGETLTFKVLKN
jgi:hypothetical protein